MRILNKNGMFAAASQALLSPSTTAGKAAVCCLVPKICRRFSCGSSSAAAAMTISVNPRSFVYRGDFSWYNEFNESDNRRKSHFCFILEVFS